MEGDVTYEEMLAEVVEFLKDEPPARSDGWIKPEELVELMGYTPEHIARLWNKRVKEGKAEKLKWHGRNYYRIIDDQTKADA